MHRQSKHIRLWLSCLQSWVRCCQLVMSVFIVTPVSLSIKMMIKRPLYIVTLKDYIFIRICYIEGNQFLSPSLSSNQSLTQIKYYLFTESFPYHFSLHCLLLIEKSWIFQYSFLSNQNVTSWKALRNLLGFTCFSNMHGHWPSQKHCRNGIHVLTQSTTLCITQY